MPFGEKPKTLENSPVAKPIRIFDQQSSIFVRTCHISVKAVRYMLNPSPDNRAAEHVDKGAVNIGDRDFGLPAPNRLGTEHVLFLNVMQRKLGTMPLFAAPPYRPHRHDHDVAKQLLRQIPMRGGSVAADVGGGIQGGHEYPRICQDVLAFE